MKNPKNILITGASSGIGAALALEYASAGMRLCLTGRDEKRLKEIAAACQAKGAAVVTETANVADAATMLHHVLRWDNEKPFDLVIANAGISGGSSGGASFYAILDTNLNGTIHTVEPILPRMMARKKGQIALMSSMAGWRGMPNAPAYSVSKMAVRAYGEALRPLAAQSKVGVSVIFPGFVQTPLTRVNNFKMPFLMTSEKAAKIIRRGLEKNKARIAFPLPMLILSRFIAALPLWLGDFILSRAPKKP
jgi:short-subunit dehydrogenase